MPEIVQTTITKLRLPGQLAIMLLLVAAVFFLSPKNLPVVVYKALLISIAVVHGYFIDRALFPYGSPAGYLQERFHKHSFLPAVADYAIVRGYKSEFRSACLRRAVIVAAVMLAYAWGM